MRVQHVGIEAVVLLDAADAAAAKPFEDIGFQVHIVEGLAEAHEASRCGDAYEIENGKFDAAQHTLELSPDPGDNVAAH
ncbi:UNVERIFIED_ORG: hypothetical protein J3D58_000450 [Paenarthrobacter nicotinovorans]